MSKNLVIVESPAKAKTIEGYLGKDFIVKSSYGHVRDLQKGNDAIDVENGFEPTYVISDDKKQVIKELKKLVKGVETVWLASDDDREGEAISWHLMEALDLHKKDTKRIVFREITKPAIEKAIETPRSIDVDLVNAQQARRVLDRLVGFELSPILWKKIKRGLSAGRVQSVAVRLVVEREREIEAFTPVSSYKVNAIFLLDKGKELQAELNKKFKTEEDALAFLEKCKDATFSIDDLVSKPLTRKPTAPFTTSTLQQEASRKLGFSVAQTMTIAQRLYEAGHITYMRTDSVNLSTTAVEGAVKEITSAYGADHVETRVYKSKSASAQEAHEAIRPTNFAAHTIKSSERNEERLYELIWKRAIASQMANAKLEKTTAKIGISTTEELFQASGEVITFDGFLKVYMESKDEDADEDEDSKGMLPPLTIGQVLEPKQLTGTERFSRSKPRYSEATLVKQLEEMGIGRPSTYAPTISTVQKREYVLKEYTDGKERAYAQLVLEEGKLEKIEKTEMTGAEKGKLFPSDMARIVNDFLIDNFPKVTDYSFTANMEQEFDDIAEGGKEWRDMISAFYGGFHKKVEEAESIDRVDIDTSRDLGKDPKTGRTIRVRLGKFGPLAQIGIDEELAEDEKPQFASLLKGQHLETITLEESLELFKLPRDLGLYEEKKVVAAIGRFGPYIRHDSKFVSIPKEESPYEILLDRAIELIEAKRKSDAEKFIKGFEENPDIQILNGRWGPYIKAGKKNVKIPKDKEPLDLTLEECLDLAEKTPDKKPRGGTKKKK
ncbi:MAG: type I DNA topoisomerase [Cyclobacteriaceae bacterium]